MTEQAHLWEIDHPYMGPESNYFANGYQQEGFSQQFDSFAEYQADWAEVDEDYNHLYRWDWIVPDPEWADEDEVETLRLFYILQRKGALLDVTITIDRADEEAVRAHLVEKAGHLTKMWQPFIKVVEAGE